MDPYQQRKSSIITWLLCHKNNPAINTYLNKDLAKFIAQKIKTDLSNWCNFGDKLLHLVIWYRFSYEWIWITKAQTGGRAPCLKCLRPCYDDKCEIHGKRTKDMLINPECKSCTQFGICLSCLDILKKQLNIETPIEVYVNDKILFLNGNN